MSERRKKLIETALPLKKINEHSAREKSIRHGHPSTLHLWWARRPLAACRAVLFAQLVDDPSSDPVYKMPDGSVDEKRAKLKREELFKLIEDLVKWENTTNPDIINKARAEIALCVASRKIELGELKKETIIFGPEEGQDYPKGALPKDGRFTAWQINCRLAPPKVVNHFLSEYAPPVLDPFAGGGSIPLEAQRLGLRAHASDLNPVAVLINKALIEIPPKFAGMPPVNPDWQQKSDSEKKLTSWQGASGLAEDVRYYGQWMRNEAEKRIGHLYPKVMVTQEMSQGRPDLEPYIGQELTVIAWLWARTVPSPNPAMTNVNVPLVRSFWLSKKKGKEAYVYPIIDKLQGKYTFNVKIGKPKDEFDPGNGTVSRTGARCLISDSPLPFDHAREVGKRGEMKTRLMAIVCEGLRGRVFLPPNDFHEDVASCELPNDYPITDIPKQALGFRVQLYGMNEHWKLFTSRQLTALTAMSNLVKVVRNQILKDLIETDRLIKENTFLADRINGSQAYADAIATYLAFLVDQLSNHQSTICGWNSPNTQMRCTFARQALPMVWDYAESNIFCESSGSYHNLLERLVKGFNTLGLDSPIGEGFQFDAIASGIYSGQIISTDPPYYDNIGYADLSDFFYVWLRRSLKNIYPDLLSTMLTPKTEEMIASPYRHKGNRAKASAFFEKALGSAIGKWREHNHDDYPTTIYYAFRQAETDTAGTASTGWETFLDGIVDHGFVITGTWPLRTEKTGRSVGIGTNALASSVVLACVPRPKDAPMATRRQFLNALKQELPDALRLLQTGSIAPVDLAQAAIGPGMAVFSRYSKVIEADGFPMGVRTALTLINQMLDEVLAEQEGEFDADTRWAVSWFEQYGVQEGPYGIAETLSKAKNTSVQGLTESGIVKSRSGAVQLLVRNQLPPDWDPSKDKRLTAWESTQYLIQALDQKGETGAAGLLRQLGGDFGDRARDLAYRLYSICERKGWASEALAYNSIVLAWPEITRLAQAEAPSDDARYKDADIFQQE